MSVQHARGKDKKPNGATEKKVKSLPFHSHHADSRSYKPQILFFWMVSQIFIRCGMNLKMVTEDTH